jgi:hypothetical protein
MTERAGGARFGEQPVATLRPVAWTSQDLYRDGAMQHFVDRAVDSTHPSGADYTGEAVPSHGGRQCYGPDLPFWQRHLGRPPVGSFAEVSFTLLNERPNPHDAPTESPRASAWPFCPITVCA